VIARAETTARWEGIASSKWVAIAGIGLGALGLWLVLPPLHVRTYAIPVLLGILAIAAGIWSVSRGLGRLGWGAAAVGVLSIGLGIMATVSSVDHLDAVFVWSTLIAATLRYATPLTFAAMGGLFSERSGVVNIGLEGMMLMGAFFAVYGADKTGSWVGAIFVAMLSGVALALVHAFFCIHLRADQIVVGTAINFLALGITGYTYVVTYGNLGSPAELPKIPDVSLGWLKDVYFIGPIFGELNLMIWLSFLTVFLTYIIVFKTPIGLRLRSVGEHPIAAETVGISVYRTRYIAVLVSGALAALGGAYLSLGFLDLFDQNLTGGRGFIALAALIFGKWRPFPAFAAALLFGFSSALGDRLPEYAAIGADWPKVFNALPYILTLIAVAGVIGRSIPPAAIGRPYKKQ
jgi:simple sugar transport system permease protein